jgi:hypothetical protein
MWLTCPDCRDESVFEQPPCEDGHGFDCPEWCCVTCGSAVFVGAFEAGLFAAAEPPAQARRDTRRPAA